MRGDRRRQAVGERKRAVGGACEGCRWLPTARPAVRPPARSGWLTTAGDPHAALAIDSSPELESIIALERTNHPLSGFD